MLKRSTRVVRGPDWPDGDDNDGGEGGVGTVTGGDHDSWFGVTVVWDNGNKRKYRVGHEKKYDLLVLDNAPSSNIHYGVTCDTCLGNDLQGMRWKCLDCENFDLCTPCYMNGKHDLNHGFERVTHAEVSGVPVPMRKDAPAIQSKGLFPGATVELKKDSDAKQDVGANGSISTRGKVIEICNNERGLARSGVKIQWDGKTTVEKYADCQDTTVILTCIKPAIGGTYFKEHLPKLGETIGIQVGDRVTVGLDENSFKSIQQRSTAGWVAGMENLISRIGIAFRVRGTKCQVKYLNGVESVLTTEVLTKIETFHNGDIVRISNDREVVERLQEGHGGWNSGMDIALGNKGKIASIDKDGDIRVQFGEKKWILNPAIAELVERPSGSSGLHAIEKETKTDKSSEDGDDGDKLKKKLMELLGGTMKGVLASDGSDEDEDDRAQGFVSAAKRGDVDKVKNILDEKPDLINVKHGGVGAAHMAAARGARDVLEVLAEAGADLNLTDKRGSAPLHYAVEADEPECVKLLLAKGAVVDAINKNKLTGLHVAASNGHVECANLIISFGGHINMKDITGDTPMHAAVRKDTSVFDILLERPEIDPGITNNKNFNSLQFAAFHDREGPTRKLVEKFPKMINVQMDDGHTAFHIAVYNSHFGCAKILLKRDECDINVKNKKGLTPLHLCVAKGKTEGVEFMLTCGPDITSTDPDGDTCLHTVAKTYRGDTSIKDSATLKQIRSNYKKYGITSNETALMCLLVQNGASITAENKRGKTALSYIDEQSIRTLLEKLASGESLDFMAVSPNQYEEDDEDEEPDTSKEGLHRIHPSELKMEQVIGKGSFGIVHKAIWRGTPVAVKVIPTLATSRQQVEDQVSVHRRTTHPNIVELMAFGFNLETAEALLVMEFINGSSLNDVIFPEEGEVTLNRPDKIIIACKVLQAITFLHQSRILHLDIKPANILLDSSTKRPYLCDLGIAHIKSLNAASESTTTFLGTPCFMPPEAINTDGATEKFTPGYDIWSLAGTLIEMFTEKYLWGKDVGAFYLIAQLMSGNARPPTIDDVEQPVRVILEPCFKQAPEERPSASTLSEKFKNLT